MAAIYKPKARLDQLKFSPDHNPLMNGQEIEVKRRHVRTGMAKEFADPETGEISAVASIHVIEEKDDQEFVKVFAAGVKASHALSVTAHRVFLAILEEYQNTKMRGGFAESIYLAWFDGGLSGRSIDMSEQTFKKGLRELLDKGFLSPKSPSLFWVNPALFFKGNRVAFIKEYRRKVERRIEDVSLNTKAISDPDRDPNTSDMFPGP